MPTKLYRAKFSLGEGPAPWGPFQGQGRPGCGKGPCQLPAGALRAPPEPRVFSARHRLFVALKGALKTDFPCKDL